MEFSTDIRAQENAENNLRKKEAKQNAEEFLGSEEVRANLRRTIDDGGSVGRRLERELQRTQSTGRISNWLSNQTTKAELSVGRERQEQFNSLVSSVATAIEAPFAVPFGGLFKYKPELPSGVATVEKKPWDIYIKSKEESSYVVGVRPATISGILPSNWDDDFSIGSGLYYGIADITTDGRSITSISINFKQNPPQQQEIKEFAVDSSVEYAFGVFSDGSSYNILQESIFLSPRLAIVTSAESAGVGESPFVLWYQLGS